MKGNPPGEAPGGAAQCARLECASDARTVPAAAADRRSFPQFKPARSGSERPEAQRKLRDRFSGGGVVEKAAR